MNREEHQLILGKIPKFFYVLNDLCYSYKTPYMPYDAIT